VKLMRQGLIQTSNTRSPSSVENEVRLSPFSDPSNSIDTMLPTEVGKVVDNTATRPDSVFARLSSGSSRHWLDPGPSMPRMQVLEGQHIRQSRAGWIPVYLHSPGNSPRQLSCMSIGFLLRDRGDSVVWRGPGKEV